MLNQKKCAKPEKNFLPFVDFFFRIEKFLHFEYEGQTASAHNLPLISKNCSVSATQFLTHRMYIYHTQYTVHINSVNISRQKIGIFELKTEIYRRKSENY